MSRLNQDVIKAGKTKEFLDKKQYDTEKEKYAIIEEREKLKQVIHNMEKEIEKGRKVSENDKRLMETMHREKDILNKNILRHQGIYKKASVKLFFAICLRFFSRWQGPHETAEAAAANEKKTGIGNRLVHNGKR